MNAQIRDEAAVWLIDFCTDTPDADTRQRFATWLCASPEHVRVYLELVSLWEDSGRIDRERKLDLDALVALARLDTNVVTLDHAREPVPANALERAVPRYALAAAAAVALVAIAVGSWIALDRERVYATDVGEQRSIKLADGSSVELNALSRIRIHYTDRERGIELREGQALFRVARDAARPFIVTSGDTRVRAVGTQFDVNRKRERTIVTVLEGRVAILPLGSTTPETASRSSTELGAGEQVTLIAAAESPPRPIRANVVAATAWTQQQLTFEATPLADVAEEFNRFNTQQLVVDASLADFKISGTFSAIDPTSLQRFVRFLRAQGNIDVRESDERIIVAMKKG